MSRATLFNLVISRHHQLDQGWCYVFDHYVYDVYEADSGDYSLFIIFGLTHAYYETAFDLLNVEF